MYYFDDLVWDEMKREGAGRRKGYKTTYPSKTMGVSNFNNSLNRLVIMFVRIL